MRFGAVGRVEELNLDRVIRQCGVGEACRAVTIVLGHLALLLAVGIGMQEQCQFR